MMSLQAMSAGSLARAARSRPGVSPLLASSRTVHCRSGAHDSASSAAEGGPLAQLRQAAPKVPLALAAGSLALLTAHPALADAAAAVEAAPFYDAYVQGFLLIFVSELGDKTFFIALLLALQRDKLSVFAGTFGALGIMTVISVALGRVLHELDELAPEGLNNVPWDDVLAVVLLTYFGIATILEAKNANEKADEEKKDAEEEVGAMSTASKGLILSTFLLVFAAEWGDKSFLATIALAATSNPVGVTAGAVTGHGAATALAVAGGGVLGQNVDETLVQYVGGTLFLIFAAVSAVQIAQGMELLPQLI